MLKASGKTKERQFLAIIKREVASLGENEIDGCKEMCQTCCVMSFWDGGGGDLFCLIPYCCNLTAVTSEPVFCPFII